MELFGKKKKNNKKGEKKPGGKAGKKPGAGTPKPAGTAEKIPAAKPVSGHDGFLLTPIDRMMADVREKGSLSFGEIAKKLNWSIESVEKTGLALEKEDIVDVHYPTLVTKNPRISFLKEIKEAPVKKPAGEKTEEYRFVVDFVPVKIAVYKSAEEQRPIYFMQKPGLYPYTKVFLDSLKDDISEKIPVEVSEITDSKKALLLKERFFKVAKQELLEYLKEMPEEQINILAGLLLHSMYGLGEIELMMGDNQLEEIAINSSRSPVTVYHKKIGWMKSNVVLSSEDEIANYASQIGRKVGREITTLSPILDAHLVSGDRVNATFSPISSFGNTITIRRFARRPWTVVDFIGEAHTMNLEMASLLWLAIQYEMNVLVAGGTASGKTSTLNALSAFIPSYHRIISIEDVREIMLPDYMHWNWVPLTTRNPNPEGLGEVSMLELMQSSLRMRPDRIIVGEMRRQREAEVLFEAMHTGHSVYSTLHANNSQEVLRRLTEPPMNIPALEVEAIDLLLVQYRDRKRNVRRTYEISEVDLGVSKEQLDINTVFKWQPREDVWEALNPASKFVRQLNLYTGMTEDEITSELEDRATILNWMLENKLGEINKVGQVMKAFYSQPDLVKNAAKKNLPPKEVLGV